MKMYVLLRMEPFPFWRKLSPFWMMINPWCKEVVLRKRTLQKSFFEGKIIHGIRKVVQISWSRVGFRTCWGWGIGALQSFRNNGWQCPESQSPWFFLFLFSTQPHLEKRCCFDLLWICFGPLFLGFFSKVTSIKLPKNAQGSLRFFGGHLNEHPNFSWATKKTSYFPWNPGCLIGILIMV